jgi:hypothetical protein
VWLGLALVLALGAAAVLLGPFAAPRLDLDGYLNPTPPIPATLLSRLERMEVERLTARCMRMKDLEYQPVDLEAAAPPGSELSPADYAAQYGFGITTVTGQQQVVEADPNVGYAMSLSSNEQATYLTALLGLPGDPEHRGCRPTATEEVYGFHERAAAGLRGVLEEFAAQVRNDPAVDTAEANWSACMARGGTTIKSHAALDSYVAEAIRTPLESLGAVPSATELQALQTQERQLAQAVWHCDQPWTVELKAVRERYATAFVQKHMRELEQVRDSILARDAALARQYGVSQDGSS